MSTTHILSMKAAGQVSAQTFFEDVCPRLLQVRRAVCHELGGKYCFRLRGDKVTSWTLDFSAAIVKRGVDEDVELLVDMLGDDFELMLAGAFDVEQALADGRLRIIGKHAKIMSLAVILQPLESD